MATFKTGTAVLPLISARTLVPASTTPVAAKTDGSDTDVVPGFWTWVLTLSVLVVGAVVATKTHATAFTPATGFSVFAVMYIVAQVIERAQEPFVPLLTRAKKEGGGTVNQPQAKAARDEAVADALNHPGDDAKAGAAAKAQRALDQIRANLTLLMWGTSSALAMLASGFFGLYLLEGVGVKLADTWLWLDIVMTGLAIGGGTKPLHDLIGNISEAKTAKQDPPETA